MGYFSDLNIQIQEKNFFEDINEELDGQISFDDLEKENLKNSEN